MNMNKWVPVAIVYDGNLVDEKSITFNLWTVDIPKGAKYYYTTDGTKLTTKSKQVKLVNDVTKNKFTFTKTCTFRMLITSPGYEDTYLSCPIGIGKEYLNHLNFGRLKDEANVAAAIYAAEKA